jgi:hypothetical protein
VAGPAAAVRGAGWCGTGGAPAVGGADRRSSGAEVERIRRPSFLLSDARARTSYVLAAPAAICCGASCCRQLLPPGCGGGDGSTDGATEVGCVDEVVLSPAPRREMGWVPRRRGASTAVVGPTEDGGGSRVPLDLEDTRGILLFPVSFQDTAAAHIPSSLSSRRLSRVPVRMV